MKKITKHLIIFLLLIAVSPVFGQKYYDDQWKKVADNQKQGKSKSNLPIILEIQNQAMKDDNANQLIRSLKAEFSIVNLTRDDEQNNTISQFFTKLSTFDAKLKGEEKWVYQVLLGEFFTEYYNRESWEINQRTNINNQDFSQIETWSKLDFKNYLLKHYADLKAHSGDLQKVLMSKYQDIFTNAQDVEYYPTLFEWNATNEIGFLKETDYFTPNEIKENHPKILEIYANLIQKNNGNAKLYFEHQKLNYNCDYNNCEDRFEQLEKLVEDESVKGDYKVLIIADIMGQLIEKQNNKLALVWANDAKEMFPKSKYLDNIKNREDQIKNPYLSIKYETHTQANLPIHIVAEAKNLSKFSLNIYEVKDDYQNFLKYMYNRYDKKLFSAVKKTLVRKDVFEVSDPQDFKAHKTSVELKPLPSGIYIAEYVVENAVQQNFYFIATNSRLIYDKKNEQKSLQNLLKIVNRENGQPISNEGLKIYEYANGGKFNLYDQKSDGAANFKFPATNEKDYYHYYLVQQPKTNDFNLIQVYGNQYYGEDSKQSREQVQIFLDRGIYRPGQIVYYKVIATKFDGKTEKETTAEKVQLNITLKDANDEEISTQKIVTNEFGSANGSFTLPQGKLNGQFNLEVDNDDEKSDFDFYGDKYFSVEEYKRPKFEVNFEPIRDEYKYGQTIEIKGKAVMFSGVPLSNSTVNYEIKKQNIRWKYFWWYPRGNDNQNSILGDVKTNEKGEFTIKLDLQKDEKLKGIQIDNYQINASVTDINGETQSANENVRVASVSHYISIQEPVKTDFFADEEVKIPVETRNYNDQKLKKSYQVKLSKIVPADRVFRSNFADEIQDTPIFTKTEFVKKFPHDYFDKKEKENIDQSTILNGVQRNEENLSLGKLAAGKYKLEVYNIEGIDTIKTEKVFEIFDKRFLVDSQKPFQKVLAPNGEIKRTDKPKIYIYSAIENALLTIYTQNGDGETITEQKKFKNGVVEHIVNVPSNEAIDLLNLQFQIVAFNDVQTESINLKIANDKKSMRIETVTFRDKLQPNEKEKWTVKILGDDKEKINAEVLANMYDKSLDQFAANNYYWQKLYQKYFKMNQYEIRENLAHESFNKRLNYLKSTGVVRPDFNWFDYGLVNQVLMGRVAGVQMESDAVGNMAVRGVAPAPMEMKRMAVADTASKTKEIEQVIVTGGVAKKDELEKVPVRQNLNETAFFYPNLLTDKDGNVTFEFTSPEALTQWKLMFLAHTKDARAAVLEKTVITQKEFSVTPNYPRFLREGDELNLQSKLSNLTTQKLSGAAQLQILDAFTNEDISEKFGLSQLAAATGYNKEAAFSVDANGNTVINWKLKVPNDVSSIILKVVAKAGNFSDGEQKAIAILPNRMLVTDAVPVFVKEGETKTFTLENLAKNTSTTATNFANTLELTTNPIWEIMFALPSLKNDVNNSADVVFNKWFADVLAAEIFRANPKMKTVFDEYQSKGLLTSNLEKNQELKQLLLEETPWVLESKSETEQMEKLARLFDANTMRNSIQNDWSELKKLQNPDGGFSWYAGYPSSYYNSLYILKNLGRINEWLKGNTVDYQGSEQKEMVAKLIGFVDTEVQKYYNASASEPSKKNIWNNFVLDYLDTRHYWEKEYPLKGKGATMKSLVKENARKAKITDFTFYGLHRAALLFDNYGLKDVSSKLLTYLKETSTDTKTQGVYWKQNLNDWGWYNSRTVNHAGSLEAFNKLTPNDTKFIEEMKIWLVTQKEVNSWGSSRGTAEVIYTILNSGKSWTSAESDKATIVWGGKPLENPDTKATGYVKTILKPSTIDKNLGTVTVTKPGPGIIQGGLFWQYYEDLDKIKSSENYVSITKELYKKVKTVNGEELQKISENSPVKVGDKITIRMILNTDRNMEFIHIKDMRAAGFEPLDVISGYQWKNSLGYYESTKDASTNFYIEYMPKGKYVFEYDYVANASGKFSNGITTLQNYYAPQMNAHTKGTKVIISEQ